MKSTQVFLGDIAGIAWCSQAGVPSRELSTVGTVGEALDCDKAVWERHTRAIEEEALARIGDSSIDWVFDFTSDAVHQPLYDGVVSYFDRLRESDPSYDDAGADAGLTGEMMDCVKRDIAWAAIEAALHRSGFFSSLLHLYRRGRWPCSWDGEYPGGRVVVL